MVWNYISCENYGLELYILRELWFGIIRFCEKYGLELYNLRELWFETIYLERTMVWSYICCENCGLELYILRELWFGTI